MSWLEFFAQVVDALAWPAALAFIVFLLRQQLRALIRSLKTVRYKGAEAEFGRTVEEAEAVAEQTALPPGSPEETPDEARIAAMAEVAPRAAVIEAWLAVEREIERVALERGVVEPGSKWDTGLQLARRLLRRDVIDTTLLSLIQELQRGRNLAAHARPYNVDSEEALSYVRLADRVADYLRRLRGDDNDAPQG